MLGTEGGARPELRTPQIAVILYHRNGSKVVPLGQSEPVVVGRSYPADAVIRDRGLSRQHARFTWDGNRVVVEDLGSTNGTRVNGALVTHATINEGDEIVLGSVTGVLHVITQLERQSHSLDGYETFLTRLEEEVTRARTAATPLSVFMVRTASSRIVHVRHLLPRIRSTLRTEDFVGAYGPGTLLIALPGTPMGVAEGLARSLSQGEPRLIVGGSEHPTSASTAEELIARARSAALTATIDAPVCVASGGDESETSGASAMVVVNPKTRSLLELVGRVARSIAPALIVGETGTGKELYARALHDRSHHRSGALQSINCGAIPANLIESTIFGHERGAFTGADRRHMGIFERAQSGTVFLDEIGELPQAAQAALLRVLETKQLLRVGGVEEISVDVRVVAATNKDLEAMAESGDFRIDLLYRLNAITIEVPPLRDRTDEVAPLAALFLSEAARSSSLPVKTLDSDVLELLCRYSWPGNVRELRNVMERAAVIADGPTVRVEDLPPKIRSEADGRESERPSEPLDADFKERIKQYELELIVDALERTDGNQTEAAKILRMPLRTLVHKISQYGLGKK